jgi:nicotinamidase/pyrazinamidase
MFHPQFKELTMSFPSFYDPKKIGTVFAANAHEAVTLGRIAKLKPATQDNQKVALLLIDMQIDFIHSDGALSVPGALADTQRTVEWIYRNTEQITTIVASLDSHLPIQIFSPAWWVNAQGDHPSPYTVITSEEVKAGMWKALYEPEWSVYYVQTLEDQARKQLMIWPYHTLIGTVGHNLMPSLYEAVAFHASARSTQPHFVHKGSEPRTENYSIFEPEVKLPETTANNFNQVFMDILSQHDLIYVAGQAKSHCVLESVNSMMNHFKGQPQLIRKIRLMSDAMSSVTHPTIDFESLANEAYANHTQHGLTMVKSADVIG